MMTDEEAKQIVKAAAAVLLDAAMEALYEDAHRWSERPCSTCRFVSGILGKPFGCYRYAEEKQIQALKDRQKKD